MPGGRSGRLWRKAKAQREAAFVHRNVWIPPDKYHDMHPNQIDIIKKLYKCFVIIEFLWYPPRGVLLLRGPEDRADTVLNRCLRMMVRNRRSHFARRADIVLAAKTAKTAFAGSTRNLDALAV